MPEFSTVKRKELTTKKMALPDGSYPIRNVSDLKNAIASFGRAKNPALTKKWIIRRAKELNATDLLPEAWNIDSVKQSDSDSNADISHFGILGMKWGFRKKNPQSVSRKEQKQNANKKTAPDYNESQFVRGRNIKSMSNADLKKAVSRMQLEQQYIQLTQHDKSDARKIGEQFVNSLISSGTQLLVNDITKRAKETATKRL